MMRVVAAYRNAETAFKQAAARVEHTRLCGGNLVIEQAALNAAFKVMKRAGLAALAADETVRVSIADNVNAMRVLQKILNDPAAAPVEEPAVQSEWTQVQEILEVFNSAIETLERAISARTCSNIEPIIAVASDFFEPLTAVLAAGRQPEERALLVAHALADLRKTVRRARIVADQQRESDDFNRTMQEAERQANERERMACAALAARQELERERKASAAATAQQEARRQALDSERKARAAAVRQEEENVAMLDRQTRLGEMMTPGLPDYAVSAVLTALSLEAFSIMVPHTQAASSLKFLILAMLGIVWSIIFLPASSYWCAFRVVKIFAPELLQYLRPTDDDHKSALKSISVLAMLLLCTCGTMFLSGFTTLALAAFFGGVAGLLPIGYMLAIAAMGRRLRLLAPAA